MNVVCLAPMDQLLLCERVARFDNSHDRMSHELAQRGAPELLQRLRLLRRLERRFRIDLGSLCHRYAARDDAHPLERMVLSYMASQRVEPDGGEHLCVMVDRVRHVRDVMEEGQQPACDWQP